MTEAPLLSFQLAWTALTTITVLPNSSEASGTFNLKPKPNLAAFAGYELSIRYL
jgi:hypothetical protein